MKTCRELVEEEISRLNGILARRGIFYDDEKGELDAFVRVKKWLEEDKRERDKIEAESGLTVEFHDKLDANPRAMFEQYRMKGKAK